MKKLHVLHAKQPLPTMYPPRLDDPKAEGIDWIQPQQEHEVKDAFVKDGFLHLVGDNHGDEDNDFLMTLAVVERATLDGKELYPNGS